MTFEGSMGSWKAISLLGAGLRDAHPGRATVGRRAPQSIRRVIPGYSFDVLAKITVQYLGVLIVK